MKPLAILLIMYKWEQNEHSFSYIIYLTWAYYSKYYTTVKTYFVFIIEKRLNFLGVPYNIKLYSIICIICCVSLYRKFQTVQVDQTGPNCNLYIYIWCAVVVECLKALARNEFTISDTLASTELFKKTKNRDDY